MTKASARSKPYAATLFSLLVLKGFDSCDTERKFKHVKGFVSHIETEDSIQENVFLKALNDLRAHGANRWQHLRYSPTIFQQN